MNAQAIKIKSQPSFEIYAITKDAKADEYHFVDKNGENNNTLHKLGDGTFGVVYEVRGKHFAGLRCVVKLLYSAKTNNAREISLKELYQMAEELEKRFPIPEEDEIARKRRDTAFVDFRTTPLTVLELIDKIQSNRPAKWSEAEQEFLVEGLRARGSKAAETRFAQERNATQNIDRLVPGPYSLGVVRILGGTETFHQSTAFKHLAKTFAAENLSISNYALIMPLYEYTLKGLLENKRGWFQIRLDSEWQESLAKTNLSASKLHDLQKKPYLSRQEAETELRQELTRAGFDDEDDLKRGDESIHEMTGYDLLRAMDFDTRIDTIIPFLVDIARGIRTLHIAGQFHRDIKPGNIYVKDLAEAEVHAVLGDLGFFDPVIGIPAQRAYSRRMGVDDEKPLGTHHYRSPEQRNFSDICDAQVKPAEGVKGRYRLIVVDPKFRDTLIEKDDYLVFSNDKDGTQYVIESIEPRRYVEREEIEIVIEAGEGPMKVNTTTQIVLYKRQRERTDLFGLGAIAYDMLTCGQSPERFYEKLSVLDVKTKSVDDIMTQYRKLYSHQSPEQTYLDIFETFRQQQQSGVAYADPSFVHFILSCMLYRARGTYYDEWQAAGYTEMTGRAADGRLAEEFIPQLAISRAFVALDVRPYDKKHNALFTGKITDAKRDQASKTLHQAILELQRDKSQRSAIPERFASAYYYFNQIARAAVDSVEQPSPDRDEKYLIHWSPKRIYLNRNSALVLEAATPYATQEKFLEDLGKDLVKYKVEGSITDPFVPDYLEFLRRDVELQPVDADRYTYRFPSSSWLGDAIREGDWILLHDVLNRVSTVDQERATITLEGLSETVEQDVITNAQVLKGIYYRNLDRGEYYLQSLGHFLHQLFFVGIGRISPTKPPLIHAAQSLSALKTHPKSQRQYVTERSIDDPNVSQWNETLIALTKMYARLVLTDYDFSYYRQNLGDEQAQLQAVWDDFNENLRALLTSLLGKGSGGFIDRSPGERTAPTPDRLEVMLRNIAEAEDLESLDFEKLLLRCLEFDTNFDDPLKTPPPIIPTPSIETLLPRKPEFPLPIVDVEPQNAGAVSWNPDKSSYKEDEEVTFTAVRTKPRKVTSLSDRITWFVDGNEYATGYVVRIKMAKDIKRIRVKFN